MVETSGPNLQGGGQPEKANGDTQSMSGRDCEDVRLPVTTIGRVPNEHTPVPDIGDDTVNPVDVDGAHPTKNPSPATVAVNSLPSTKEKRAQMAKDFCNGEVRLPHRQNVALHLAVSWPWLLVQVIVVGVDMALIFAYWTDWDEEEDEPETWHVCMEQHRKRWVWFVGNCLVWLLILLDMILRTYAFGVRTFFSKAFNKFDTFVFVISCFGLALEFSCGTVLPVSNVSFLRLARVVRVLRMFRMASSARRASAALTVRMRRTTGMNKKRYVDPFNDFDLDLTYITGELIAMSVPAQGCRIGYRNPLPEVVRFFEWFHKDSYQLINLCPELPYPASAFRTGLVERFDVQDHTPPLIADFVRFFDVAQKFIRSGPTNILAVHCKGGKGRTGSFCSAWLMYRMSVEDAEDATQTFALRRTDMSMGHGMGLQGVETPSQVRFVGYIEKLLRQQKVSFPDPVQLPERVDVRLLQLEVTDLFRDKIPGELIVAVHDLATRRVIHWSGVATNFWDLGGIAVHDDTRISVFARGKLPKDSDWASTRKREMEAAEKNGKKNIAGKEKGCLFYFLFHTSFLGEDKLTVSLPELDKAWKRKFAKKYHETGSVTLTFSRSVDVE